jgi:PAS domain S-box-containing protein
MKQMPRSSISLHGRSEIPKTGAALREQETLLDSLPAIVWTADAHTFRFTYVSAGAHRILGYPVERWVDDPNFWSDHIHPEDQTAISLCHSETMAARDHELLYRMIAADGREVWLRDRIRVHSENDTPVELSGVMFDVTAEIQALRALRQSEENYSRMINLSPDAIGVHTDGRYIYVNPSFTRLFGATSADELIGREVLSFIHPDFVDMVRSRHFDLASGEHVPLIRKKLIRLDGTYLDAEVMALSITFNGQPAVQVVIRDISEQVRAEERIRLISAVTYEAIFEGDLVTNLFWSNPTYKEMIGDADQFDLAREQHLWRVHPDDRERVEAGMRLRLETGTARWSDEYRMELASGDFASILERGRTFRDSKGEPSHVLVALLDITALRHAEEQIHRIGLEATRERAQSEQRYQQIVEGVSDVIYTLDIDGKITSMNRAFQTLTGFRVEDWIGRPFTDLLLPASIAPATENFLLTLHGSVGTAPWGGRMRTASGGVIEIETSGQQRVMGDPTHGTIGIARDVTERNLMERRFEESKRLASLGNLAASIAHEMNNVLMAIQPSFEVLMRHPPASEQATAAHRRISATIGRGKRITGEILNYANPKKSALHSIEPQSWMAEVTLLIAPLLPESVELLVQSRLNDPLLGDHQHLEQVITNLVLNAVQAMPGGGLLCVELTDEDPKLRVSLGFKGDRPLARLTVRDNGSGIPTDVLPRIFDPLFTTKRSGTGLGLAIAKRLVEGQGGALTVESTEGCGTAFHIFLPMALDTVVA